MKFGTVLENNVKLLSSPVNKYTVISLVISLFTIGLATCLLSYQMTGRMDIDGVILAQKSNIALWFLDLTPFIYSIMGQSMGNVMAYKASAMVLEQTNELSQLAESLEEEIKFKLTHDALTGLPNRTLFSEELDKVIADYKKDKNKFSVIVFNINGFKDINDAFGEMGGNLVLVEVAQRLNNCCDENNKLSRIHNDEFVLIVKNIQTEKDAVDFIAKINKRMSSDFHIREKNIQLSLTAGIYTRSDEDKDADTVLHHVSVAASHAKNQGKTYAFYEDKLDEKLSNKLFMTRELKHAIANGDLKVFFQPKIQLETSQVLGAEALARWEHPDFGKVPPEHFVALAEETGLINHLTFYILDKVFKQLKEWQDQEYPYAVSINISIINVIDSNFPSIVDGLLRKHQVTPEKITFEIVESAYMDNAEKALDVIQSIANLGIKFSIDDFGTGYSSFTYLVNLPVSEIKIDKSFILNMMRDKKKYSIVEVIIHLGKSLGLNVVAEGIEDVAIVKELIKLKCGIGQGFYFSRPLHNNGFIDYCDGKISQES